MHKWIPPRMSLLKHTFASRLCIAEITFELALLPRGLKTCKSGMTYVIRLLREGEMIQPELMSMSTEFYAYTSRLPLTSNLITSIVMITFYVKRLCQLAWGRLPELRAGLQFCGALPLRDSDSPMAVYALIHRSLKVGDSWGKIYFHWWFQAHFN